MKKQRIRIAIDILKEPNGKHSFELIDSYDAGQMRGRSMIFFKTREETVAHIQKYLGKKYSGNNRHILVTEDEYFNLSHDKMEKRYYSFRNQRQYGK